jgi:putative transposase
MALAAGWTHQAYRYEVGRPRAYPAISSHQGARRFAWNWGLSLIEEQLDAQEIFRVLALRQGATQDEAIRFAESAASIPYLVELNAKRRKEHERLVAEGKRQAGELRAVSEWCPWSKEALRYVWSGVKDEVAPWWAENSKECYSAACESLSQAFKHCFDSRAGNRGGARVGQPKYKSRASRQSVAFTTGSISIVDRHHVQLPGVGILRVKEPTDKLRLKIQAGTARILQATVVTEGARTYVSFGVVVQRTSRAMAASGVGGHDVGITVVLTSADDRGTAHETANPKAGEQVRKTISCYQRRMDCQHRTGSPRCFDARGRHIPGTCY